MSKYDDLIIASSKCVAYWPLDDVGGAAIDRKSGTYNATGIGSGITRAQPGPVSQALSYKGDNSANAQVRVPSSAALNGPGTTFELEFWVQFNGDQQQFFEKNGTHSYRIQIQASGLIIGILTTGSGTYTAISSAGAVRSGEWAMVSMVWASNLLIVFVNNVVAAATGTAGSHTTNTAALDLFSQTAGQYVNDYATRFALYNAGLTNAERMSHYRTGNFEAIVFSRQRAARSLSWALCDRSGNQLTDLPARTGGSVEIELNGPRRASVTASLEEDVARLAMAYGTVLKVWLAGTIIFAGQVNLPRWVGRDREIELNAVDASERLANSYTKGFAKQTSIDQAEIMWRLIAHAQTLHSLLSGGSVGVVRGETPNSYLRERYYADGKQIWEALQEMSQVTNGPDFELMPLDRTDGVYSQLQTYFPYQGYDRTDTCIFTFNTQENNAVDFTSEPGGGKIINFAIYAGQAIEGEPAPAWQAYHADSIAKYGVFQHFEALPDVKYTATLQEYAEMLVAVRAEPVEFFDLVPAVEAGSSADGYYRDSNGLWVKQSVSSYGIPPPFGPVESGGHYWIGDEIRAIGRDHGLRKDVRGRVTFARISEVGEHGDQLGVELTCAPTIDAAGVTGAATTVSTEDFS